MTTLPRSAGLQPQNGQDEALTDRLRAALRDIGPLLAPVIAPVLADLLCDGSPAAAPSPSPEALLPVAEAARRLGIGRTTTFELIRSGQLRSVTVGRRRLVPSDAIGEFVSALGRSAKGSAQLPETTVS